jgi:hypothetical protein
MRVWTKEEMRGRYVVQLDVAGQKFNGEADLPQSAKHNAAMQALPMLHSMPDVKSAPSTTSTKSADVLGMLPNGDLF